MQVINNPLPESDRETAGAALQATLPDLLDLSLVAKQAHWNLHGPRFRSVHVQLDEPPPSLGTTPTQWPSALPPWGSARTDGP